MADEKITQLTEKMVPIATDFLPIVDVSAGQTKKAQLGNLPSAAHKTTHENAGGDEISVLGLSGLLADGQTPLAHKTSHEDAGSDEISVTNLSGVLADKQNADKIQGHIVDETAVGNDKILVLKTAGDKFVYEAKGTPAGHAASHQDGGGDEISVAALSGVLADRQDANKIQGHVVDETAIADDKMIVYKVGGDKFVYEAKGTPGVHHTSHEDGGGDEIDCTGLVGAGGGGGGDSPLGYFSNLKIYPTPSYTGYRLTVTANAIILTNGSLFYQAYPVNLTAIDLTTSGVNGLDTGTPAGNTWYYIWVIYNGATVAGLLSLSSTTPTLPAGYTYYALVGAVRNHLRPSHLHFDGADQAVTFTDVSGKTWTTHGSAKLVTATKKFGTASGNFASATSDYIDTPDHADFTLGNKDFTVECWVKRATIGAAHYMAGQSNNVPDATTISFIFCINSENNLLGMIYIGGSVFTCSKAFGTDTASFHHVALVRRGGQVKVFMDGVGGTPVAISGSVNDSAYKFSIGRLGEYASYFFNGNIDEFVMTVGEAKYWRDFTPPTAALQENAEIMQFHQAGKAVQLDYFHKCVDNGGSTTTASIDLSSCIPPNAISVGGKVMANTGALSWYFNPASFENSILPDSGGCSILTLGGASYSLEWRMPILLTPQIIYHQAGTNNVDVWLISFMFN